MTEGAIIVMQERLETAQKLAALILSHGEKTEATALPFWYIAVKGGAVQRGRNVILRGVWFNREDAETHLKNKAHRYPKNAFVYCDSGHDSWHLKEVYRMVRELAEPFPDAVIPDATVTFFEGRQAIMPGMSRTEEEIDRQAAIPEEEKIDG